MKKEQNRTEGDTRRKEAKFLDALSLFRFPSLSFPLLPDTSSAVCVSPDSLSGAAPRLSSDAARLPASLSSLHGIHLLLFQSGNTGILPCSCGAVLSLEPLLLCCPDGGCVCERERSATRNSIEEKTREKRRGKRRRRVGKEENWKLIAGKAIQLIWCQRAPSVASLWLRFSLPDSFTPFPPPASAVEMAN